MKKWITLVLMMLCMMGFCFAEEGPAQPIIHLAGNPTTGYTWTYEISDPEVLAIAEEYKENEAADGMVGVGGASTYAFTGLKEGSATVTFRYARSWENETPAHTLVYLVNVDAAGNAVIAESIFEN